MRICLFTPTFLPTIGGVELAVHHIATQLAETGNEVCVVTFRGRRFEDGHKTPYEVKSLPPGIGRLHGRLAFAKEYSIAARLALLRLSWKYDLLNVHVAYPGGIAARHLKTIMDVPTVVTCHARDVQVYPELEYGLRLQPGLEPKIKQGIESADQVTTVSKSVSDDIRELCPSVADVHVIPNGVSAHRFRSATVDMRAALGVPESARLLLAVGRNHPKKGYPVLIKALANIARERQDFRCVIAGAKTESLVPLVADLGLKRIVLLPGSVPANTLAGDPNAVPHDELVSLYMQSDLFVMPSHIEGLPLVIPEAMMAGLPVVATEVPGNKDMVEHLGNGLLVPPGDDVSLSQAIQRLLDDDGLREKLSANAKASVRHHDWASICARYEAVYKSVIDVASDRDSVTSRAGSDI